MGNLGPESPAKAKKRKTRRIRRPEREKNSHHMKRASALNHKLRACATQGRRQRGADREQVYGDFRHQPHNLDMRIRRGRQIRTRIWEQMRATR